MDDLISRQAAIDELVKMLGYCFQADKEVLDAVVTTVRELPSARSENICCKDCKYNYGLTHGGEFNPDDIVCTYFDTDGMQYCDYCSYGER